MGVAHIHISAFEEAVGNADDPRDTFKFCGPHAHAHLPLWAFLKDLDRAYTRASHDVEHPILNVTAVSEKRCVGPNAVAAHLRNRAISIAIVHKPLGDRVEPLACRITEASRTNRADHPVHSRGARELTHACAVELASTRRIVDHHKIVFGGARVA